MKSHEGMQSTVTLKNVPKLSEHAIDEMFNERRIFLVPQIERFVAGHELFKGKETNISFAQKGVSSIVAMIEDADKTFVLKVPLSLTFAQGESMFLKAWENAGVHVPHIFEEGSLGEHSYVLMDFIDAPTLGERYTPAEMAEKKKYEQMGATLRAMHAPVAHGYGRVVDGKAEHETFVDWLISGNMQKRIEYVEKHSLLDERHGTLQLAQKLLMDQAHRTPSCYCHDDFSAHNIFDTDPITPFDPNPQFNNGYLDVGRSLVAFAVQGRHPDAEKQFIDGYFRGHPFDPATLQASILLNAYMKFPYWHKTEKTKRISDTQAYLEKNRDRMRISIA